MIKNPGFSFAFWEKRTVPSKGKRSRYAIFAGNHYWMYVQEICCNLNISKSSVLERKTFISSGSAEEAANPNCGDTSNTIIGLKLYR
jgi:hypothetical protein